MGRGALTPKACVFFVGFPRSGHSLVGQILNAHPNALVSHELNAFGLLKNGKLRDAEHLFRRINRQAREFANDGAVWSGYSYAIKAPPKGDITLIGDKKGGVTAALLARQPDLWEQMQALVGRPCRLVCVTRHPADMVAAHALRLRISVAEALAGFGQFQRGVEVVAESRIDLRWEDLIAAPETQITRLADLLGLSQDADWLAASCELVRGDVAPVRDLVTWSPQERAQLAALMARAPLDAYRDAPTAVEPLDGQATRAFHQALLLAKSGDAPAAWDAFQSGLAALPEGAAPSRHLGRVDEIFLEAHLTPTAAEFDSAIEAASAAGCPSSVIERLRPLRPRQ